MNRPLLTRRLPLAPIGVIVIGAVLFAAPAVFAAAKPGETEALKQLPTGQETLDNKLRSLAIAGKIAAVKAIGAAIEQSNDPAQLYALGRYYRRQPGPGGFDMGAPEEAVRVFRKVIAIADGAGIGGEVARRARLDLALMLLRADPSGERADEAKALLRQAAQDGSARAALELGRLALSGTGDGNPDAEAASTWWRQSLASGEAEAAVELGEAIRLGRIVADSGDAADGLFRRAVVMIAANGAGGDPDAAERLGDLLMRPSFPFRDPAEARSWYQAAAEGGRASAMLKLAGMWSVGEGGPTDPRRAGELLLNAAEAGSLSAALIIARATETSPFTLSPADAQTWLNRALAAGSPEAVEIAIDQRMRNGDLPGAARMARDALGRGLTTPAFRLLRYSTAVQTANADVAWIIQRLRQQTSLPPANSLELGAILMRRESPYLNPAEGLRLMRLAAESGFPGAINALVLHYRESREDVMPALRPLVEKAAASGDLLLELEAAGVLGRYGDGKADKTRAHELMAGILDRREAISPRAALEIGRAFASGAGVETDFKKAFAWLKQAADGGVTSAMYDVGLAHMRGLGVPRNPALAREWLLKAAGQGSVPALLDLAAANVNAQFGAVDLAAAQDFLRQAAAAGSHEALRQMAVIILHQGESPESMRQGMDLLAKAADAGNVDAMFDLSMAYRIGQFVPRAPDQAWAWLMRAAKAGHQEAQYMVGVAYRDGIGATKDRAKARQWLLLAAHGTSLKVAGVAAYTLESEIAAAEHRSLPPFLKWDPDSDEAEE